VSRKVAGKGTDGDYNFLARYFGCKLVKFNRKLQLE